MSATPPTRIAMRRFRAHMAEVMRKVAAKRSYIITRRGTPVAYLTPPPLPDPQANATIERTKCHLDRIAETPEVYLVCVENPDGEDSHEVWANPKRASHRARQLAMDLSDPSEDIRACDTNDFELYLELDDGDGPRVWVKKIEVK